MENREQEILSEIKTMMASIRSQLEILDAKMAELQQVVTLEEYETEAVDIDIDLPAAEVILEPTLESEPEPKSEPESALEPEVVMEVEEEKVAEPEVELTTEDLPEAPVKTIAEIAEEEAKPSLNETMATNHAWRRDMPGTPVKDVRSAISLNDRVIFINLLFEEDAQTFVNTLTQINAMNSLDEAVSYLTENFPVWDMNSELVYRFMMAVRRKLQ